MIKEHKSIKEYEVHGPLGSGSISRASNGSRIVELKLKDKQPVAIESLRVDLEKMGETSLRGAIDKACFKVGYLPIFEHKVIKGPFAVVNVYHRPYKTSEGYATISKPKIKQLRFSLDRIDLQAMNSSSVIVALKNVALKTGVIKLSNRDKHS